MKAQITIANPCQVCGTITAVTFESGDAATKLIHCGACGEWQPVTFQEVKQDEQPADDKPKRKRAR